MSLDLRPDYADLTALRDRIPAEEPIFILRAQDHFAAMLVRKWADQVMVFNPDYALLVKKWADLMAEWPVKKYPDIPPDIFEQARAEFAEKAAKVRGYVIPGSGATPEPTPDPDDRSSTQPPNRNSMDFGRDRR